MENEKDTINVCELSYLKFDKKAEEHIVTLIDEEGFEVLKGYGKTLTTALNDLHQNLI